MLQSFYEILKRMQRYIKNYWYRIAVFSDITWYIQCVVISNTEFKVLCKIIVNTKHFPKPYRCICDVLPHMMCLPFSLNKTSFLAYSRDKISSFILFKTIKHYLCFQTLWPICVFSFHSTMKSEQPHIMMGKSIGSGVCKSGTESLLHWSGFFTSNSLRFLICKIRLLECQIRCHSTVEILLDNKIL